jgi:spore maturation protein CgeB
MRILYAGGLNPAGTCLARMQGLIALGHHVSPLDYDSHISFRGRVSRVMHHLLLIGPGIASLNRELLKRAQEGKPEIVWIDKGTYFWPRTLRRLKEKTGALLVHHCTDDIKYHRSHFRYYLKSLDIYDAHFTSNLHNIDEMRKMTSSYVGFNEIGYDDKIMFPVKLNNNDQWLKSDIFFIGHWEENTEQYIRLLAESGLPVTVRGPNWSNIRDSKFRKQVVKSGPIYLGDYVKAINGGQIGLGIVSKWNRNHTAGRIFEIPACGTLLLAERNPVLERLYEDGKEAALFCTGQDLIEKAAYYLKHPEERRAMGLAGRQRCLANKCTWRHRVAEVLAELQAHALLAT